MIDPAYDLSKTTIAPDVLTTIARLTTLSIPEVSRMCINPPGVKRLFKRGHWTDGVLIQVEDDTVYADLYIILRQDVNIQEVSREIQHQVARAITEMVGMQVGRVNIHVEDIDYQTEPEA